MVEDQARTLNAASEGRIQHVVAQNHPVMHWLIRHASHLLAKFHIGADRMTGYQRLRGKTSTERIAEFGEHDLCFFPRKKRAKMDPKWRHGFFLARAWDTDADFIGLVNGQITTARAMARCIETQRWSAQRVLRITGTPIKHALAYDDTIESLDSPQAPPAGQRDDGPDADEKIPRRLPILQRDLVEHGCTDGCTKCDMPKSGQHIKARTHEHTEMCRAQLYAALRNASGPRIQICRFAGSTLDHAQAAWRGKHEPNQPKE